MALLFADRVRVAASAAPGTGTFAVGTAVSAYQGFPAAFVVGSSCYYLIEDGTSWEVGVGTLTATAVWTRTTVLLTSAGNTTALTLTANAVLSLTPSAQFGTDLQARADSNYGRNRIRNSRFQVNQRGTSGFAGSGSYTSDGWLVSCSAGTMATTIAAASSTYNYSGSLTTTTTGLTSGANMNLLQRIESYDVMDLVGQQVTVSFTGLATTSAGSFTAAVGLYYPSAQDNFGTNTLVQSVPVTLTATATRVSVTFSTLPANIANGLQVAITLTQATSTGTTALTVAGVQLEAGSYVTALEKKPIVLELEWAQRFYCNGSGGESFYDTAAGVYYQQYFYPTPMRAAPTVVFTATSVANLASGVYTAGTALGFYVTTKATAAGLATYTYTFTATAEL
nr:hypothetical protein [uncultured Lichenicoccus sp.]